MSVESSAPEVKIAKAERAMKKEADLKEANASVFYKAFRSMDAASRRRIALRILKDEAVLEDLYDHFLIQEAQRGQDLIIRAEEKKRKQKTEARRFS
ncbi:MAG: hypothetical protein HYY46_18745 [Deltaproteobacteria bacterium]|nr:hypothetical protein [Deltaproteobacteria bacterium]